MNFENKKKRMNKNNFLLQDWVQNNQVLTIVLRDSLHQPQYVEKLEKILRFMIKEKALTSEDLDKLWEAQVCCHTILYNNQILDR